MAIHISVELSHVCPLDEIGEHADALEAHGFHRVWVPDTLVSAWEAWMAASLIVQRTRRIQVGLGVTNPYTRHPVVVAQMAATLQRVSSGRLSLSIGKGIGRFLEKAGVVQHESAVEECIEALHGMIAGERTSVSGKAFHIDGMQLRTLPPDRQVPIYLAAIGPASWDAAVRVADGIATVWNEYTVENFRRASAARAIPVAVMVPFAQTPGEFLGNKTDTVAKLRERVDKLAGLGFDEVIIGYRDRADLDACAELLAE